MSNFSLYFEAINAPPNRLLMQFITDKKLHDHIGSIIHQETQQHQAHYDLTVAKIYRFADSGSLDFGGSEFQPAEKQLINPHKKAEDDDYGWWNLTGGAYQAKMNEHMKDLNDCILLLTLHQHSREVGIIANTTLFSDLELNDGVTINFHVPDAGCSIKENARFAVARLLKV